MPNSVFIWKKFSVFICQNLSLLFYHSQYYDTLKLIALLFASIILWTFAAKNQANILWFIIIGSLSIRFIVKNKNVEKKDVLIGVTFGSISVLSSPVEGVFTILAYIGATSVFKNSNNKIILFKKNRNVLGALSLIIVNGGLLGVINLILAVLQNIQVNFSLNIYWVLRAFNAGIAEEILFRFLFFAVCIRIVKDKQLSKLQSFIIYLIMVVPHTLIHFNLDTFNFQIVVVLCLLFGLPFAILQRRRDLLSAIGAHTIVDIIRFCVFGV
ncbi:CPBP family glutamic-type intramembrane protease [Dethiothermospora halolimnae]|uniref:CPBP family glutamic-type intramembrane protease n=1 Tax=Dethiothermospora halolimnae TaxID=3114390 RepID=UPI003CCB88F5